MKTAFVLAGGGSLGAVEVGMLRALVSRGIRPDLIVGSSVGALNAFYFASTSDIEGVEALKRIWLGLRKQEVFPGKKVWRYFWRLTQGGPIADQDHLRLLLERHLPCQRIEETKIPCHVIATDILGGEEVCLSSGPAIEALLASTAIPAFFPPIQAGDRVLVDGGLANNTPISTAVNLGATELIVLPTGFSCSIDKLPLGAVDLLIHTFNLFVARQLATDIERYQNSVRLVVVPPICPVAVSPFDFTHSEELIQRGTDHTLQWLEAGGLVPAGVPATLRPHSHKMPKTRAA